MNKLCKEYISSVASFFPVIRKPERQYIASLKTEVEDFCVENNIRTLEELYENYKYPSEVAKEYYALAEPADVIQKIQIRKWIRGAATVFLALVVTSSVLYGIRQMNVERIFRETDQFFKEYHEQQKLLDNTETE